MDRIILVSVQASKTVFYDDADGLTLREALDTAYNEAEKNLLKDGFSKFEIDVENISSDAFSELLQEEGWIVSMDSNGVGTAILPSDKHTSMLTIDPDKLSIWTVNNKDRSTTFRGEERVEPRQSLFHAWHPLKKRWWEALCN